MAQPTTGAYMECASVKVNAETLHHVPIFAGNVWIQRGVAYTIVHIRVKVCLSARHKQGVFV